MSQPANIVVADSASANHTFVPTGKIGDNKGTLRWINRNALNPAASEYITILQQYPNADAVAVAARGLELPQRIVSFRMGTFVTYVDTATGLTMVDMPLWIAGTAGIPIRAAATPVADIRVMFRNLLNAGAVNSTMDGTDPIWQ